MKDHGLFGYGKPKFVITTRRNKMLPASNLLKNNPKPQSCNQVWVSDITYIPTSEGWLYVCTVIDVFSRRLVGWSMGERIKATIVAKALNAAIRTRKPGSGIIFHSDQGSQYHSHKVKRILRSIGAKQSMAGAGRCYDNAMAESFFSALKKELIHRCEFKTRGIAKAAIFEYMEVFYNKKRLHSALSYLTPAEFEGKSS